MSFAPYVATVVTLVRLERVEDTLPAVVGSRRVGVLLSNHAEQYIHPYCISCAA